MIEGLFLGFCFVGLAIGIPILFCIKPMVAGLSGGSDSCPPPPLAYKIEDTEENRDWLWDEICSLNGWDNDDKKLAEYYCVGMS